MRSELVIYCRATHCASGHISGIEVMKFQTVTFSILILVHMCTAILPVDWPALTVPDQSPLQYTGDVSHYVLSIPFVIV